MVEVPPVEGISQSLIVKTNRHTHTITASDGDGPFTVVIKIYETKYIIEANKSDWWKGVVTSMQFTMHEKRVKIRKF